MSEVVCFLVVGFIFFRHVYHMSLECTSVFQHYVVDLCLSAYVPGSLSYSHAPCPRSRKKIPFPSWRRLWVCRAGPSPRRAQLRQSCSHTRHFLHPQRNDRSGKPMLIKAGSLASLILSCVPTCRYVMPSTSWLWLNILGLGTTPLGLSVSTALRAQLGRLLIGPFWFPACESLLNRQMTETNTILDHILCQPEAFHIQQQ